MLETMENVRLLRNMIKTGGYEIDIEVDGGINVETAAIAAAAGANVLVAGSSVFLAEDAEKAIADIRSAAETNYLV
jgi:ribulose-phosphate 3-epimerase